MSKIRNPIRMNKERVILSDVLPYEIPATYSNRYFHKFLLEHKIALKGLWLTWENDSPAVRIAIELVFGIHGIREAPTNKFKLKRGDLVKIPFCFNISHKKKEFRELTIIHPQNQIAVVEFYNEYKGLILYYSSISPFSIRRPHKIATVTFYEDRAHSKLLAHDHEHSSAEESGKEYETLKTFFAYKDISNIYKFYESYRYHRCEKIYNTLYKFDVMKCFDSIYTHAITWALLNEEIVKDDISSGNRKVDNTFGGRFDKLMQTMNYNETNGIVIGPEFSRIFAEIILQRIDRNVYQILLNKDEPIILKRDYELFRYVDDCFVFYNDEHIREEIVKAYRLQLKDYKMHINESKSLSFKKPIITGLTRAKLRIVDLFDEKLVFKSRKPSEDNSDEKVYSFYVSSNKLITRFKSIIEETEIEYKDIMNYSLACVDRKIVQLIKTFFSLENREKHQRSVAKVLLEMIEFSFFLYSVSPRVNSTVKLCTILSKVTKFVKIKGNFNIDDKHIVLKKIYDDIFLVLNKYRHSEQVQVETLYLLIVLKDLGQKYRISERVLGHYFGLNHSKMKCSYDLNYFSIVVLLFYIGSTKKRYSRSKSILKSYVLEKLSKGDDGRRRKSTEHTMLMLDLVACPFLDRTFKKSLFDTFGYKDLDYRDRTSVISLNEYWFTKWTDFDFIKELDHKRSFEVY